METSGGSPTGLTVMVFDPSVPVRVPDVPEGLWELYEGLDDEDDDHVTSKLLSYWGIVKLVD